MEDNIMDPEILKKDQKLVRNFRMVDYEAILTYSNEMGLKGWQIIDKDVNEKKKLIDVTFGKTKGWEERTLMFDLLRGGTIFSIIENEKGFIEILYNDGEVENLNYVQIQGLIQELKEVLNHKEAPDNLHKMLQLTIKAKRLKDAKKKK